MGDPQCQPSGLSPHDQSEAWALELLAFWVASPVTAKETKLPTRNTIQVMALIPTENKRSNRKGQKKVHPIMSMLTNAINVRFIQFQNTLQYETDFRSEVVHKVQERQVSGMHLKKGW